VERTPRYSSVPLAYAYYGGCCVTELSSLSGRILSTVRAAGSPVLFGALAARFGARSLEQRRELRALLAELELAGLVRRTYEGLWAPWVSAKDDG